MALLTPLNVNCHASDGRKVRAKKNKKRKKLVTGTFCITTAPLESHYGYTTIQLVLKGFVFHQESETNAVIGSCGPQLY